MDIELRKNGHIGITTRVRAWFMGIEPEKLEALQTLLRGYRIPRGKHNSLIIGGPTAWTWEAAVDDAHHGNRGAGLHADSHARQHALDSAADHTGTITDVQHGARGAALHADSHDQAHDMDAAADHNAAVEGDIPVAGALGVWVLLGVGAGGEVLTIVAGVPAWAALPAPAIHGNEAHNPDFYALDGTIVLTAPLSMQLMAPGSEPAANAGNEGKLYYLTPGAGNKGIIKQIMKNSTGAFEQVQISVST